MKDCMFIIMCSNVNETFLDRLKDVLDLIIDLMIALHDHVLVICKFFFFFFKKVRVSERI